MKNKYLSDREIAELLGISVAALRNKIACGAALPPRIQPSGCKHRLWSIDDVQKWLKKFRVES